MRQNIGYMIIAYSVYIASVSCVFAIAYCVYIASVCCVYCVYIHSDSSLAFAGGAKTQLKGQ